MELKTATRDSRGFTSREDSLESYFLEKSWENFLEDQRNLTLGFIKKMLAINEKDKLYILRKIAGNGYRRQS